MSSRHDTAHACTLGYALFYSLLAHVVIFSIVPLPSPLQNNGNLAAPGLLAHLRPAGIGEEAATAAAPAPMPLPAASAPPAEPAKPAKSTQPPVTRQPKADRPSATRPAPPPISAPAPSQTPLHIASPEASFSIPAQPEREKAMADASPTEAGMNGTANETANGTADGTGTFSPGQPESKPAGGGSGGERARGEIATGTLAEYRLALSQAARRLRYYPTLARERGLTGRVSTRIVWRPALREPRVELVASSGYELLDKAALDMLTRAVRDTPLPENLRARTFELALPVEFNLQ